MHPASHALPFLAIAAIVAVGSALAVWLFERQPESAMREAQSRGSNRDATSLRELRERGATDEPGPVRRRKNAEEQAPEPGATRFWESYASATYVRDKCVLCMVNPADSGFLHGNSVHVCACQDCALKYRRESSTRDTCPVCRQLIDRVVRAH